MSKQTQTTRVLSVAVMWSVLMTGITVVPASANDDQTRTVSFQCACGHGFSTQPGQTDTDGPRICRQHLCDDHGQQWPQACVGLTTRPQKRTSVAAATVLTGLAGATLGWVATGVKFMDRAEGDEPTPKEKMQGIIAGAAIGAAVGFTIGTLSVSPSIAPGGRRGFIARLVW